MVSLTLTAWGSSASAALLITHNLSAQPCTKDGSFLNKSDLQTPPPTLVDPFENPWAPFRDRLEFDWAYYHYVRLQSSKSEILEGLDLWRATAIKHSSEHPRADAIPWRNADDLYQTIDCIQDGDAPWRCYKFTYSGPRPVNSPRWMEDTYELNARDALLVLEQQLDTPDFHGEANYIPYMEFNANGDRVYSNFMSAHWVSHEAVSFALNLHPQLSTQFEYQDTIAHDPATHGSMLVPVIAGSDKTTVSVATGHQEYHPVYISPGIISNTARRGHGNGVLPVAFLPIPKSMYISIFLFVFSQFLL